MTSADRVEPPHYGRMVMKVAPTDTGSGVKHVYIRRDAIHSVGEYGEYMHIVFEVKGPKE